ncbi:hypothetical protein QBC40DRAFT_321495 [Triangularia verruculosa]|uniref:Uncharacterized protein n=1 Tax=Triangularia verruculosa TaxID=2587418 RepID=A0AAN6XQA7_9PEZI|nr:hypothetical protein QBC40DRAFT_321495 [Triangularia verruculosa]
MANLDSHSAYLISRGQVSPLPTPKSLADQLKEEIADDIVVMHGLPPKYLDVFLLLGGTDPSFLESFASRREYRPFARSRSLNGGQDDTNPRRWCIFEYPELVQGLKPLRLDKDATDTVHPPVVKVLPSSNGKTSVIFCRVATCAAVHGDLILLDNPVWRRSWHLRKAPWRTTVSSFHDADDIVPYCDTKEAGSLEDSLVRTLQGKENNSALPQLLVDLVYERWLELFEYLESPTQPFTEDTMGFYWQVLRSLEFNEEEGSPCWRRFLDRVQRRISLLSLPTTNLKRPVPLKSASVPVLPISPISPGSPSSARSPISPRSAASTPAARLTPQPTLQPNNDIREQTVTRFRTPSTALRSARLRRALAYHPSAEENRRALDRISYMGGVLIPLPIVSGILSMGEIFGPSGPRFWIFWAVSVPLAIISVLIIYADTIRKAEVWVEVAPENVVPSRIQRIGSSSNESEGGMSDGPVDVEVREHRTVTWRRHHPGEGRGSSSGEGLQQRPQAPHDPSVVFALNHDIEERIIDIPLATAAVATAAVDPVWDEDVDDAVLNVLPARVGSRRNKRKKAPIILQRSSDGNDKPKAWKRQELGWYGAMKSVMWKKPRALEDVPDGVMAYEKPGKRKSKTF